MFLSRSSVLALLSGAVPGVFCSFSVDSNLPLYKSTNGEWLLGEMCLLVHDYRMDRLFSDKYNRMMTELGESGLDSVFTALIHLMHDDARGAITALMDARIEDADILSSRDRCHEWVMRQAATVTVLRSFNVPVRKQELVTKLSQLGWEVTSPGLNSGLTALDRLLLDSTALNVYKLHRAEVPEAEEMLKLLEEMKACKPLYEAVRNVQVMGQNLALGEVGLFAARSVDELKQQHDKCVQLLQDGNKKFEASAAQVYDSGKLSKELFNSERPHIQSELAVAKAWLDNTSSKLYLGDVARLIINGEDERVEELMKSVLSLDGRSLNWGVAKKVMELVADLKKDICAGEFSREECFDWPSDWRNNRKLVKGFQDPMSKQAIEELVKGMETLNFFKLSADELETARISASNGLIYMAFIQQGDIQDEDYFYDDYDEQEDAFENLLHERLENLLKMAEIAKKFSPLQQAVEQDLAQMQKIVVTAMGAFEKMEDISKLNGARKLKSDIEEEMSQIDVVSKLAQMKSLQDAETHNDLVTAELNELQARLEELNAEKDSAVAALNKHIPPNLRKRL